jgi:hypothetical protein
MKFKIYISVNTLPNTNYIFSYLLDKIQKSKASNFEINVIHDSKFNYFLYKDMENLNLNFILGDDERFEYPALKKIWDDSQNDEFYVLYLHVKGASKVKFTEIENSIAWIDYMLYGLLDNIDLCINHLDEGADIVGSMWHKHFKGNFFWSKSSYVKTLFDPYSINMPYRFFAEYWICIYLYQDWFEQSRSFFGTNLKRPTVKNLFNIELNGNDNFLKLKNSGYVPDLTQKKVLVNDIRHLIATNTIFAFDEIYITEEDLNTYSDFLFSYLNYDAKINIIDVQG